ncbi:MAG: class I SAM-dependent methyltransferase [Gammaproteobacteria bacterium]
MDKAQRVHHFHIDQETLPRLQLTAQGLVLLMPKFSPLMVDFNITIPLDKKHALIRACKPTPGMTIMDVTAGWGRDAALLAHYGAKIIMVERQPIMAALLADGLKRLVPGRLDLSCIHQDAFRYLEQLSSEEYPDVIYIDPMHPERQKTALVKKDMQALQQLLGPDANVAALLALAKTKAKKKVIIKWPQRLPALSPPNASFEGKTVRFDMYML